MAVRYEYPTSHLVPRLVTCFLDQPSWSVLSGHNHTPPDRLSATRGHVRITGQNMAGNCLAAGLQRRLLNKDS